MNKSQQLRLLSMICFGLLVGCRCSWAQTSAIKRQISEIKLDSRFVYGEACNADQHLAFRVAMDDLKVSLGMALGVADSCLTGVEDEVQVLQYDRADKQNVFVYLLVADFNPHKPSVDKQEVVSDDHQMEILTNVLEREMVENIYGYLSNCKNKGMVAEFAKARSLDEIPDDAYVVIYDRTFRLVSVLLPVKDGARVNAGTGEKDRISNYSGHGVIWYK